MISVLQSPFVPAGWLPTGLTITAVGAPDHGGTVEIGENGLDVVYTPAAGFEGVETFTYTVMTEAGRSATATRNRSRWHRLIVDTRAHNRRDSIDYCCRTVARSGNADSVQPADDDLAEWVASPRHVGRAAQLGD